MGRPLKGRGSQKTCLNEEGLSFADTVSLLISRIKGESPDRYQSVRGFFYPGLENDMTIQERST